MIDAKPLGLSDEQFQMLMATAAQLHCSTVNRS
jgi:hypothetical protein